MGQFQKIALAVVGVAMVTTLILPGRKTTSVLGGFTRLSTGTLSTAMGTTSGVQG